MLVQATLVWLGELVCNCCQQNTHMAAATPHSWCWAARMLAAWLAPSSWLCCVDMQALTQEDAATKIQAGMRGHLSRKRTKQGTDEELSFIGMRPKVGQSSCCTSMAGCMWGLSSMLVCATVGSLAALGRL